MKVLIFAAHPDDIEISMGATLSKYKRLGHKIQVVVLSSAENKEGNQGIEQEFFKSMGIYNVDCAMGKFLTDEFHSKFNKIKDYIYAYRQFEPDIIFSPSEDAMHDDHRVVARAVKAIFITTTIYAYCDVRGGTETLVNMWEEITEEDITNKFKSLICYTSQIEIHNRYYFDLTKLRAMSEFRGLQCNKKLAEAFQVVRQFN